MLMMINPMMQWGVHMTCIFVVTSSKTLTFFLWTSVENYIVNLDARYQPQKYYAMHPSNCAPLVYGQKVSVLCMFHVHNQRIKTVRTDSNIKSCSIEKLADKCQKGVLAI